MRIVSKMVFTFLQCRKVSENMFPLVSEEKQTRLQIGPGDLLVLQEVVNAGERDEKIFHCEPSSRKFWWPVPESNEECSSN